MPIRSLATFAAALIAGTALAAQVHGQDPELAGAPMMAPGEAPPDGMEAMRAYHHHQRPEAYAREEDEGEFGEGPGEYGPPPGGPGPGWCPMAEAPRMEEHHMMYRRMCGGHFHHRHFKRTARAHHRAFHHQHYRMARVDHGAYRIQREERWETEALAPPPPPPHPVFVGCPQACGQHYWPKPTTFETGYIDWPGKVHF